MRRLLVALAIFLGLIALPLVPSLIDLCRRVSTGAMATDFVVILGSPKEIFVGLVVLLLLAIFAYWVSGKLVRTE